MVNICYFFRRVLNLTVAMIKIVVSVLTSFLFILPSVNQITPGLYVTSPIEGKVISGRVEIRGSVPDDNFESAEVSYAFSTEGTPNWFLISKLEQPVHDSTLAFWDTTTITDGVYKIKVLVNQRDGSTHEVIVENIKVGNYTSYDEVLPTSLPAIEGTETIAMTVEPTEEPEPQPTPFPRNPASIDRGEIVGSLSGGLILALLAMILLGVYAYFRKIAGH